MKLYLFLLLGMAPLAMLTARSTWVALSAQPSALPAPAIVESRLTPENEARIRGLCATTHSECKRVSECMNQLAVWDGELTARVPAPPVAGGDGSQPDPLFERFCQDVEHFQKTCGAIASWAAKCRRNLPREVERIHEFRETRPFDNVPGSQEFVEFLDQREEDLKSAQQAAETLRTAEALASIHNWRSCLEKLQAMSEGALAVLTPADRSTVAVLKSRAMFRTYWEDFKADAHENPALLAEHLSRKLRELPVIPRHEDDVKFLEQLKTQLHDAEARAAVAEVLSPKLSFRAVLEGCDQFLREHPEAESKLRAEFRDVWIPARLYLLKKSGEHARDQLNIPRAVQEAWRPNGGYLRGVFVLGNQSGAAAVWYKYWDNLNNFHANRPWLTVYRQELDGEPGELIEVAVLSEFRKRREELSLNLDNKFAWEKFGKHCRDLKSRLEAYYERRNLKPEDCPLDVLQLQRLSVLSETVVNHWTLCHKLLQPDPRR